MAEDTVTRAELVQLYIELRMVSSIAAAVQAQMTSHIAACDELRRQMEARQKLSDDWDRERADVFSKFMAESSADRARIRETVLTTAATGRDELRVLVIKAVSCVAGFNIFGAIAIVVAVLTFLGKH